LRAQEPRKVIVPFEAPCGRDQAGNICGKILPITIHDDQEVWAIVLQGMA
jgi:hypothetical protein